MNLEITQQDIDEAVPVSPGRCALALAFRRITGLFARVGCHAMTVKIDGVDETFNHGVSAKCFVGRFDKNKKKTKPTTVSIELPRYAHPLAC